MVDKRAFKKPINTRGKLELMSTMRNARLEVFSSGNIEWRQWSGDWILLKKNPAQHYQTVQTLLK